MKPRFIDDGVQFEVILRRGPVFSPDDVERLRLPTSVEFLPHMQKVLVPGLSRGGEDWTATRMCSDFSSLARNEESAQVDGLRARGLVELRSDHLDWSGNRAGEKATPGPDDNGQGVLQLPHIDKKPSRRMTRNGPSHSGGPGEHREPDGEQPDLPYIARLTDRFVIRRHPWWKPDL